MESKICFNWACRATKSAEWKEGWVLRSGGFADLCHDCGTVYENSLFCETFHRDDSGWRECSGCNKRLHCGCAASRSSVELLDAGGVECIGCMRRSSQLHPNQSAENLDELRGVGTSGTDIIAAQLSNSIENRAEDDRVANEALLQMGRLLEANGSSHGDVKLLLQSQNGDVKPSSLQVKREEPSPPMGEIATDFLNLTQPSNGALKYTKPDKGGLKLGLKDTYVSLAQPSLSISLKAPFGTQDFTPFLMEGKEQRKSFSSSQQGQKSRPSLPKHSKSGIALGSETNKDTASRVRVARPPAEGRGRNQLLPRYWPRITDQELQQLSGHLNSTIVPLFEKVLSASDAGRIGRLVLPKACAEAYFPPINQSEGLPIKIQDGKGKEWTFQFRFWPNNNSRMYVLEGVTPCIQSMQLYAGDTVTFSRIDPGGKLVIGYRKASISVGMQDAETSALPNETLLGETAFSGIPTVNGYSGNFESLKGSKEDQSTNSVSGNLSLADGDNGWYRAEKFQRRENEGAVQSEAIPEKKRTRNIGSKSKRLHIHSEDAKELRLTWEEAQDLLRPAPSAKPSIVTIEDHEFEEYDEPPVFGKRTIFTVRPSGEQEQWAQCDNCSKWRSLPVDVLLPPNWTCSENVWDPQRSLCSAPDEMSPKDQEIFFRAIKGAKRRRTAEILSRTEEREPSGLDALASVAVLGENPGDLSETSVGATTKHPRHRPGCTCIVCIQPPSGKGKHKPSCACNVCTTVRRRFKTLMLRKKIRQSEREAEFSRKHQIRSEDDNDIPRIENGRSQSTPTDISFSAYYAENGKNPMDISFSVKYAEHGTNHLQYAENGRSHQSITEAAVNETGAGQIDLNYPEREEAQAEATGMSMMDLVNAAGFPLENYLRQNGLASLICEQHGSLGSSMPPAGGGEDHLGDERYIASVGWENNGTDDGHWQLNTD